MKRAQWLCLGLILTGTGFEPWRAMRPVPVTDLKQNLPIFEPKTLSNGMSLVVHQDSYLPLVNVRLLFRAGNATEGAEEKGVLQLLYRLLFSENLQLLSTLDTMGTEPTVTVQTDGVSVSVEVPADSATAVIAALAKALREPNWEPSYFAQVQSEAVRDFRRKYQSARDASTYVLWQLLYPPGHPLHRSLRGVAASLQNLKLAQVQAAYKRHVTAKNLGMILVGRIAPVVAQAWTKREFSFLSTEAAPQVPRAEAIAAAAPMQGKRRQIFVLPYPNLSQTVMTVGAITPAMGHPDSTATSLAAGRLSSYLTEKLREDKNISYGIGGRSYTDHLVGSATIQGSVDSSSTGYAVREIISQLFQATSDDTEPEVMALLRSHAMRRIGDHFTTLSSIAGAAEVALKEKPDYFQDELARIQKVDTFDITKAMKAYLKPDFLTIVLAGDPALIRRQVEGLGMGTVVILESLDSIEEKAPPVVGKPARTGQVVP
jgi:zinc protease